ETVTLSATGRCTLAATAKARRAGRSKRVSEQHGGHAPPVATDQGGIVQTGERGQQALLGLAFVPLRGLLQDGEELLERGFGIALGQQAYAELVTGVPVLGIGGDARLQGGKLGGALRRLG